jgi:CBS domain-containing protein
MFSQRVEGVMDRKKLLTTSAETSVSKATKLMAMKHVGAILILEEERLVGIFTERDAVFRVLARGRDPEATPLADVMTPSPRTISPREPFGRALATMHKNGFRHLPVVENGVTLGIVSSRSALDPEMEEFVCEARRREAFASKA